MFIINNSTVRRVNKTILLRRVIYHFEKEERICSEIFRVCNPKINDKVIQSPKRNTYAELDLFPAILSLPPNEEYTVKKRNRYGMEQTRLIKVNGSNVAISKPGGKNNLQYRDLQVIRDIKKGNNDMDNSFIATIIRDNEVYEQIFTCTSKSECSSIIECVKYAITK
jgi:hypothetical protein